MKSRISLVLMEQLVMVLVFALAAAACLRIFVWSAETSREIQERTEAVILCQNAAELVKASGNLEAAASVLDAAAQDGYTIELQKLESHIPGLSRAEIRATADGEVLFSLVTGWQEDLP